MISNFFRSSNVAAFEQGAGSSNRIAVKRRQDIPLIQSQFIVLQSDALDGLVDLVLAR
jgi:hypothetical protein